MARDSPPGQSSPGWLRRRLQPSRPSHAHLTVSLRSLHKMGEIGGPPKSLTVERLVDILIRSAEGAKHEAKVRTDRKALERSLEELALIAIAAMKT